MSRRDEKGFSSMAGVVGAAALGGLLGGLGYAVYKAVQEEPTLRIFKTCERCEEGFDGPGDTIKLLCNHYYHVKCLREAYQLHSMMNLLYETPFQCHADECYFRIPQSVINSIKAPGTLQLRGSGNTSDTAPRQLAIRDTAESTITAVGVKKCEACNKEMEPDIKLSCNHYYHKDCIIANFIVHLGEGSYYCPVQKCKTLVAPKVVHSFFKTT